MGRLFTGLFLIISTAVMMTGCSVAVPNVTSLISNFNSFRLTAYNIRIENLSALSSISLGATCDTNNLSFEYQIPPSTTWDPVPVSSGGPFASITNNCSNGSGMSMTLDLSSTAPFSTMTLGDTHTIHIRDVNALGISQTETFSITYSLLNLANDSLINGQGYNNTLTGSTGTYTLRGRVTNIPKLETTPDGSNTGTYTLRGKVHFQ